MSGPVKVVQQRLPDFKGYNPAGTKSSPASCPANNNIKSIVQKARQDSESECKGGGTPKLSARHLTNTAVPSASGKPTPSIKSKAISSGSPVTPPSLLSMYQAMVSVNADGTRKEFASTIRDKVHILKQSNSSVPPDTLEHRMQTTLNIMSKQINDIVSSVIQTSDTARGLETAHKAIEACKQYAEFIVHVLKEANPELVSLT